MRCLLTRLSLLFLISVSVISISVQAQDDSTPRHPCWSLTNPPDSPADDSLQASLAHSALQMVASGENDTALTLFDQIIDDTSDEIPFYALRGCLHARMGSERDAIDDWETFIDLSDDETQITEVENLIAIYSGEEMFCYAGGGIYASQREALDEINAYDPSTAKGEDHNQRGLAYLCLGYYDHGLRDFARALDSDKNSSAYYNNRGLAYSLLEDQEKAIRDFNKAIDLEPDDPISYANRANSYLELEDYGQALVDFNNALRLDPAYEYALNKRATVYRQLSDPEHALEDYTALIEMSPSAFYYNNRGLIYLDLELYEDARDDFIEASTLIPASPIYWYNLGNAYISLSDMENALDAFNHSIELDPSDPEALDWRAYIYFYIDENGLCIADYTVLFTMDGPLKEKPGNWWRRGTCYHVLGNLEQAVRDYNKALELNPDYAEALAYRGVAYHTLDRIPDALDDLTLSIELDDTDPFAWRERGLVYDAMEDYENAIDDYDEALALNPDYALTYVYRGYAYYELKDYAPAKDDFETYLDMQPESDRREEIEGVLADMADADS